MIRRSQLLDQLSQDSVPIWLVEAGAGFGKSVLLEHLRGHRLESLIVVRRPVAGSTLGDFLVQLASATRSAGHPETAAAITASEGRHDQIATALVESGRSLGIDDVDRWDDAVTSLIKRLIEVSQGQLRVVATARKLPLGLSVNERPQSWGAVGHDDLALTLEETIESLVNHQLDASYASLVHEVSQGWPLAVAAAIGRMATASDPLTVAQELGRHENLVEGLLQPYLSELDQGDRRALGTLATLPFFDAHIVDILGESGLSSRLSAAGIPLTFRLDGWAEIPDPFRSAVVGEYSSQPEVPTEIVYHYVARGEVHGALTLCVSMGKYELAAELISLVDNSEQTRLEPSLLNATIATIGDAVSTAPRALLVQAQVNATFGRVAEGRQALQRAASMLENLDPSLAEASQIEVLLEIALWHAMFGENGEAELLLDRCVSHFPEPAPPFLSAKAHDVRGMLHHNSGIPGSLDRAAAEFSRALQIWREIGDPRCAAVTVFRLASGVLADLGRRSEALDLLDTLPSAGPMTLLNRARLGLERSILLPYLGRAHEVASVVAGPRRIAGLLGHDWLVGWTYWTEIVAASVEYEGARVQRLLAILDEKGYVVLSPLNQAVMWCEISEALARCGLADAAREVLERARGVKDLPPWFFDYSEASINARVGDAAWAMSRLDLLDAQDEVDLERRWRIALLLAYANHRLGNLGAAARHLGAARARAEELGHPSLPEIVDRRLVAEITSTTSYENEDQLLPPQVTVSVFGSFAVTVDGSEVAIPRGQPSVLLKVLVVGGGQLLIDQVIDPLWPDVDLHVGRRRLRNVLNRLRDACGDIVERRGDLLELAAHVSSDYARAGEVATRALSAAHEPATLADAIAANHGDLLPGDRYEDWASAATTEHRAQLMRLYDAQAALAETAGDLDLTVSALCHADELDDFGGQRRRTAARLLREAGRQAAASALL